MQTGVLIKLSPSEGKRLPLPSWVLTHLIPKPLEFGGCIQVRENNYMLRSGRYLSLVALLFCSVIAASSSAKDDFDSFLREQEYGVFRVESEFRTYKEKEDREFASFLKSRWRDFEAREGKARMLEPEPTVVPQFRPDPLPKSGKPLAVDVPTPTPTPLAKPPGLSGGAIPEPPLQTQIQKKPVASFDGLNFAFYGNELRIPFDAQWKSYVIRAGDKPSAMSEFWTMMSSSRHEPTFKMMAQTRQTLGLDDWAYLNLWREFTQTLEPQRSSEQNLLLWFFLVKSGFDVRMAYFGDTIYLLIATQQQIYESPQVVLDGRFYYPLLAENFGVGMRSFYTYEANYPGKLNAVKLDSIGTRFAKLVRANRTLAFKFNDKPVSVSAPYNAAVIPYFNRVPPMDFSVYFKSDASEPLKQELLPELKRQTAKMSEADAVQFLLTLVQFSFEYKTTLQQFGRDKAFFVDDVLYFPYSDCKARAVVFAWLVRNVLGHQVVGLHYPNHLTTAVALKGNNPEWVTIQYRGHRYVYADPTFVGAPVGRQQREYRGVNPISVIEM